MIIEEEMLQVFLFFFAGGCLREDDEEVRRDATEYSVRKTVHGQDELQCELSHGLLSV